MSITTNQTAVEPGVRPLTIADVAVLPTELPSGTVDYELDDGRLVIMVPPGDLHGALQAEIVAELINQGQRQGHGKARSEVGIVLRRNPDRLVAADAAFIANRSLPLRHAPEGYLETVPDLIVEIRSKNDTAAAVQQKVDEYLTAGARVVWVIDPGAKTVASHHAGEPVRVFTEADTLTLGDVIPGFQLPVANLFSD